MIWRWRIFSKTGGQFGLALGLLGALICPGATRAATVSGQVALLLSHDPNVRKHQDYSGVVVCLEPLAAPAVVPVSARHAEMIQKNKTFSPHVLAITVGTI